MNRISKEEVAALPIRRYEGEIVLVSGPTELERALADLGAETVAGFDTETRPAFRVGETYLPSIVQLATASAVYVFQVQRQDFAQPLVELMQRESIVKAGVSVADDLIKLKQLVPFEERSVLDLGKVAKRHGIKQSGVRNLAGMLLGFRIPKGSKTSNWAAARLTPQQIAYAAMDAWACRELYLKFKLLSWV